MCSSDLGGENVVEGAVLANDDDHVLDGGGGGILGGILSGYGKRRAEIRDKCDKAGGNGEVLPGLRQETGC